jgi:hypothetical protein
VLSQDERRRSALARGRQQRPQGHLKPLAGRAHRRHRGGVTFIEVGPVEPMREFSEHARKLFA